MKHLKIIFIFFITTYSFSQKIVKKNYLKAVNDFLELELRKERYKNYPTTSYDWCLVENYNNVPVGKYENDYKSLNKGQDPLFMKTYFPIDSLEIEKIKLKYSKTEIPLWETKDFPNFNFKIIKYQLISDNIKSGKYLEIKPMLVIIVTLPLFINKNKCIIGFRTMETKLGGEVIDHSLVMMVRKKGKWEKIYDYYDGYY